MRRSQRKIQQKSDMKIEGINKDLLFQSVHISFIYSFIGRVLFLKCFILIYSTYRNFQKRANVFGNLMNHRFISAEHLIDKALDIEFLAKQSERKYGAKRTIIT